jgi:phosphatidylglycerophosphate synthase
MNAIRSAVRAIARAVARFLNAVSGGHITPSMVTYTGLLAHLPIAWLIATTHNVWAAGLLIIFGLFDVLDGELARLQGTTSQAGMLLDSVTDRVKEVLLYLGVSYAIVFGERPHMAVWAVAACGASLLVSYVNAWGEAVSAGQPKSHQINKAFRTGLMGYEVRMFVLVVGLLSNRIILATMVIALLASLTALQRFIKISQSLKHAKN